jgi:hypothetical protein
MQIAGFGQEIAGRWEVAGLRGWPQKNAKDAKVEKVRRPDFPSID